MKVALTILVVLGLCLNYTFADKEVNNINLFKGMVTTAALHVRDWQERAQDGKSVFGFDRELGSIWQNKLTCTACHLTAGSFNWILSREFVYKNAEKLGTLFCSKFIDDEDVCYGAVTEMGDILIPQLTSMVLTADYSCSRLYGFCDTPVYRTENRESYIHRMISDKPDIIKNNDYIDKLYEEIKKDTKKRETLNILHMSDLHVDLEYTVGNNKNCGEPLCCMSTDGPAPTPEDAAGQFGEYTCDMPYWTLETMFDYVKNMNESVKPDLVLWTGDNVAHDIWNQTVHKNTQTTILITEFIKTHWPEMPVFVTPGNHEFYPVNVETFNTDDQPILQLLAEHWIDWIDPDDLEQFKKYGYYSIPLKSISEELSHVKVITLNTQASNNLNWGLLTTTNDPGNQLKWLEEELKEIEANNQVAYIIGHIPSSTTLHDWAIRYKALVERYQHVIRFQGYGHDHEENVYVARGAYDFKPFGSYHLAGSVTTFTGKNPTFRVMEVDKETMLPLKMHTYFLNMTRANLEGKATWEHRYEFTDTYNLEDLSPSSLAKLPENFFTDPDLAVKWLNNKYGQGGSESHFDSCNEDCLFNLECDILSTDPMLAKDCRGEPRYNFVSDMINGNFGEYLFDPWVEGPF